MPAMSTRRYAAFLRGVMPTNCKMTELRACFEAAGFTEVRTVLGSGNVVFSAPPASEAALARTAEAAMADGLGRAFLTIVRPLDALRALIDDDPFAAFSITPGAKRVVTFLREPRGGKLDLPIELDGARLLGLRGGELFTAYLPSAKGPVFMTLIQKTFGDDVTTRTWDTVKKVVGDHGAQPPAKRAAGTPAAAKRAAGKPAAGKPAAGKPAAGKPAPAKRATRPRQRR